MVAEKGIDCGCLRRVLSLRFQAGAIAVFIRWRVAAERRAGFCPSLGFVGGDRTAAKFGAAPAMMVPRRRGATNTTLAATQRHPCRSGMVTADCAWSRSRPESVRLAALKDQRKIPAFAISLTHSRARGADDGGRRRRDASYGAAVGARVHHLSHPLARALSSPNSKTCGCSSMVEQKPSSAFNSGGWKGSPVAGRRVESLSTAPRSTPKAMIFPYLSPGGSRERMTRNHYGMGITYWS